LDWCPDLSGSGNSDAEADRCDSREELHACTSVDLEQSDEFLTLDPTNLYTAAPRLMKPFGQKLIQSFSHPKKSVRCGVKEYRNRVSCQALERFEGHSKLVLLLNIFLWYAVIIDEAMLPLILSCSKHETFMEVGLSMPRAVNCGTIMHSNIDYFSLCKAFNIRFSWVFFFVQASRTREAPGSWRLISASDQ
jgi:hypothetical protein